MKKDWPIKLTENAEDVLLLAEEEAQAASCNYVGAQHILIALVRHRRGISGRAVTDLGLEIDRVRAAVAVGEGEMYESYLNMKSRAEKWATNPQPPPPEERTEPGN